MSVLALPELNPAFLRVVGRNVSYLKSVGRDELVECTVVPGGDTGRVRTVVKACESMGMLVKDPENDLNLCVADGWRPGLGVDASKEDFVLSVSRHMSSENIELKALHKLVAWMLARNPLATAVDWEGAIRDGFGQGEAPYSPNQPQKLSALRWLRFLGVVRTFDKLYVSDPTRWLEMWIASNCPQARQSFQSWWDALVGTFPLLGAMDTSPLPRSIGLALEAIERRGLCEWEDVPDDKSKRFTWAKAGSIEGTEGCTHVVWKTTGADSE